MFLRVFNLIAAVFVAGLVAGVARLISRHKIQAQAGGWQPLELDEQ